MDPDILSALGVQIKWVWDRVSTRADFKPRHIGRSIEFEWFAPNADEPVDVIGAFEGYQDSLIIVSGEFYEWEDVQNVKIWRRVIGNG